jgi:hypothetical protein
LTYIKPPIKGHFNGGKSVSVSGKDSILDGRGKKRPESRHGVHPIALFPARKNEGWMLWRGLSSLWGRNILENGINQSAKLLILGANTTDFRCGNYGGGGLDAVALVQFKAYGAGTHPMRVAKGFPIATGTLVVGTHDVSVFVGREPDLAKVFTGARQTRKIFVAIFGQI